MRKNWIWALSLLLIGGMASCKSSQSAYKAAYEKAQEKKIEEPTPATTPVAEQQVVTTPSTTTTSSTSVRERSERINAVDGNDALLKEHRASASVCATTAIPPYWLRMPRVGIVL